MHIPLHPLDTQRGITEGYGCMCSPGDIRCSRDVITRLKVSKRGPEWVHLDLQVVYLPRKGPEMGPYFDPFWEVQMTSDDWCTPRYIPWRPKGAYRRDTGACAHQVSRGWIPCIGPSKRGPKGVISGAPPDPEPLVCNTSCNHFPRMDPGVRSGGGPISDLYPIPCTL